eukprot:366001-Chlamydomonas_euryale.AAC.10
MLRSAQLLRVPPIDVGCRSLLEHSMAVTDHMVMSRVDLGRQVLRHTFGVPWHQATVAEPWRCDRAPAELADRSRLARTACRSLQLHLLA